MLVRLSALDAENEIIFELSFIQFSSFSNNFPFISRREHERRSSNDSSRENLFIAFISSMKLYANCANSFTLSTLPNGTQCEGRLLCLFSCCDSVTIRCFSTNKESQSELNNDSSPPSPCSPIHPQNRMFSKTILRSFSLSSFSDSIRVIKFSCVRALQFRVSRSKRAARMGDYVSCCLLRARKP